MAANTNDFRMSTQTRYWVGAMVLFVLVCLRALTHGFIADALLSLGFGFLYGWAFWFGRNEDLA